MIAVDTSALMAVLLRDSDARRVGQALVAHLGQMIVSAVIAYEFWLVADQRELSMEADSLWAKLAPDVIPMDERIARIASQAYHKYGKGRHPAALNFADCISYALAKERDTALLYKGNDFAQTDIRTVI